MFLGFGASISHYPIWIGSPNKLDRLLGFERPAYQLLCQSLWLTVTFHRHFHIFLKDHNSSLTPTTVSPVSIVNWISGSWVISPQTVEMHTCSVFPFTRCSWTPVTTVSTGSRLKPIELPWISKQQLLKKCFGMVADSSSWSDSKIWKFWGRDSHTGGVFDFNADHRSAVSDTNRHQACSLLN